MLLRCFLPENRLLVHYSRLALNSLKNLNVAISKLNYLPRFLFAQILFNYLLLIVKTYTIVLTSLQKKKRSEILNSSFKLSKKAPKFMSYFVSKTDTSRFINIMTHENMPGAWNFQIWIL